MPLTLPADILEDFAGGHHGMDALADRLNPGLKPLEITLGFELDDAHAIATKVPLQRHGGFDTVKAGIHEPMPP